MKNGTKINNLITNWLPGAVYTVKWLRSQGYSNSVLQIYKTSGWLISKGAGAVAKKGDQVDWQGAVWALQQQLHLPIHVGGRTAIEQAGSAQYLNLGREKIFLVGEPKTILPAWFKRGDWGVGVIYVQSSLFDKKLENVSNADAGFSIVEIDRLKLKYSSRERAMLEYLDQVPERYSLEEAYQIMENLITLKPKNVQTLLMSCKSIKAKRLFLALAEKAKHPWLKKLDLSKVNLGKGPRHLAGGGEYNSKYQITIGSLNE